MAFLLKIRFGHAIPTRLLLFWRKWVEGGAPKVYVSSIALWDRSDRDSYLSTVLYVCVLGAWSLELGKATAITSERDGPPIERQVTEWLLSNVRIMSTWTHTTSSTSA